MKQYINNIIQSLYTILVGMKITWKHLFVPAVTIQYPEVKPELPERARNRIYVNIDDCMGCKLCEKNCPVDCITVETVKSTPDDPPGVASDGKKKVFWVTNFEIDFSKCCFCQICTLECSTNCINMTEVYEYSEYSRDDLVYKFSNLTEEEIKEKQEKYANFMAEKKRKQAEAKAKAEEEKKNNEN